MADEKKRKAYVLKNFKDAGTGERFTAKSTPLIGEGAFANYVAAGLIRDPDADKADAKPA